jgi:hypothetical protein
LGSELVRGETVMGANTTGTNRRIRGGPLTTATLGFVLALASWPSSAGASSRLAVTTTSPGSGGVLLLLGGAVLVLGGIGFFVFTWTRRKNRPNQCAAQREALEQAERAVRYWEGARSHLEAVERERTLIDAPSDEPAHATLVAKAVEGLNNAMKQRDQCQMDLIRCMASGVAAVPINSTAPLDAQPFFIPGPDGTTPSSPNTTNP